jgi:LAS superfamily LD-carboxypeptidase LdcB
MVTVPSYQRSVSDRPILQQKLQGGASADDFGAGIGRGMQSVAQGVSDFGAAIQQVQELEDIARAKEADNGYASWVREATYGENGFMTLEGRAAVDQRAAFEAQAEKKRQEFGAGLTGGAAKAYKSASTARVNSLLDQSISHTSSQRKAWFKEASTARLDTFSEDALAGYNSPALVSKNIAAGQAEIRSMGALEGWDADTLKNREAEYVSGVHKNIALRMAQTDPLAADKYRKDNLASLTGPHQYDLEGALGSAVKEAEAIRATEEVLKPGRTSGQGADSSVRGAARVKEILTAKSVAGAARPDAVAKLNAGFATNLAAMLEDAPPGIREGLGLYSAYRSEDRQAELFAAAVKKYGSENAARKWVAPPGNSYHNHGEAVDLAWNGQSLQNAPREVIDWVHQNAGKYGMYFPMAHEPWHIEPKGTRGGGVGTVAPRLGNTASRAGMPSFDQIEAGLANINDPVVRDLARKRINSMMEAQSKAETAARTAAKNELWSYVEQGATPDQVPQEIRTSAGLEAVSSAWSYIEAAAKRGAPEDDDVMVYDMRRYAAQNPKEFAALDLNDYRARLSPATFKEMTALQTGALTDQRKAADDGIAITAAMAQAGTALEGLGITTVGKKDSEREAAAKRIAQFQNVLAQQMTEFKAANEGRNPNQAEIGSMVNRLLLPIVVEQPGMLWGTNKTEGQFLFEANSVANDATVSVAVSYEEIPRNLRVAIGDDLQKELGRKPSEDEVAMRYNQIIEDTARVDD